MRLKKSRARGLLALAFVIGTIATAYAVSEYLDRFRTTYPATTYPEATAIASCSLCHTNVPTRNPYGMAFAAAGHSFTSIESADSDGDGFTNIQEITAGTYPGDSNSKPSTPPPDTTAPTVTAFTSRRHRVH